MPSFRSLVYAYVQAFTEQILLSGACNGAHGLKERLARWLLMMRDRSDDDALPISQNLLAEMLGVQRPTITNAAGELEREGLIERGRRQVTILNRPGLMKTSCNVISCSGRASLSTFPKRTRKKAGFPTLSVMYVTDRDRGLAHNALTGGKTNSGKSLATRTTP